MRCAITTALCNFAKGKLNSEVTICEENNAT